MKPQALSASIYLPLYRLPVYDPITFFLFDPAAQSLRCLPYETLCTVQDSRGPPLPLLGTDYLPRLSSCRCIASSLRVALQEVSPVRARYIVSYFSFIIVCVSCRATYFSRICRSVSCNSTTSLSISTILTGLSGTFAIVYRQTASTIKQTAQKPPFFILRF